MTGWLPASKKQFDPPDHPCLFGDSSSTSGGLQRSAQAFHPQDEALHYQLGLKSSNSHRFQALYCIIRSIHWMTAITPEHSHLLRVRLTSVFLYAFLTSATGVSLDWILPYAAWATMPTGFCCANEEGTRKCSSQSMCNGISLINCRWSLHLGWKARLWTGDEPSQVWYYRDSWWSASMLKVSWRLQYGNEQSWFGVKLFPSMINKQINPPLNKIIDKCSSTASQTIWISTKLHFKFTRHGSEFAWPRFHGEAMISKDSGAL